MRNSTGAPNTVATSCTPPTPILGVLPRDLTITQALIETKDWTGYPKHFRAAYAKNSNDRVFEMATRLERAGICKGVTLALQSTDPHTLEVIKRKNMAMNRFEELVQRYDEARNRHLHRADPWAPGRDL